MHYSSCLPLYCSSSPSEYSTPVVDPSSIPNSQCLSTIPSTLLLTIGIRETVGSRYCIMNPLDAKLILDALDKLFAEQDARWDRRFADLDAAWDRRLVSRGGSVPTPVPTLVAAIGVDISVTLTAPPHLSGQKAARGTSSVVFVPTQRAAIGAEVAADNWGGLFEDPSQIVEEPVAITATELQYTRGRASSSLNAAAALALPDAHTIGRAICPFFQDGAGKLKFEHNLHTSVFAKLVNPALQNLLRSTPATDVLQLDRFCVEALEVAAEISAPASFAPSVTSDFYLACPTIPTTVRPASISIHVHALEVFDEMAKHNSKVLWPPPMHISNVFCTGSVPLVDKSIQSFFSPPSCHSWDAVAHKQPWPPPMQFELQNDGVQLRPMPWPSFSCLIVWINAYFQYKCLIWILYRAISGNFWKHWYTCMFRDEVIWISFNWEGQCDLSFPHIPSLYDSADTHFLSTFVSLLACQQSDLYMLCAVDKLSNRLLQKFTTPIHAPAAVLTFKIKCSLLIQVLSSNSLVQGQHICRLTEIIGTSYEHGKLIELMSLGYFTWILTKNYLCVSDMCHSTKAGFLVKYLVPGVEFCPDNELSEMKTYIHILSVFDKDTHIQPQSWLLQHTYHILSASIKVKLLWSSPHMRMVLLLSQLVVCPCSICIFCDCILMGALGSISCPLVTCCRYKREEDILLRFQQQKRGNAAIYLMCHLAHFASQNKDIQLLERINFALWAATNRMHLQYCDVGDFIWLALSGSSNGSNSYHSPSSRRNGVIFRTGKSLWLLQRHFYHLLIEDP